LLAVIVHPLLSVPLLPPSPTLNATRDSRHWQMLPTQPALCCHRRWVDLLLCHRDAVPTAIIVVAATPTIMKLSLPCELSLSHLPLRLSSLPSCPWWSPLLQQPTSPTVLSKPTVGKPPVGTTATDSPTSMGLSFGPAHLCLHSFLLIVVQLQAWMPTLVKVVAVTPFPLNNDGVLFLHPPPPPTPPPLSPLSSSYLHSHGRRRCHPCRRSANHHRIQQSFVLALEQ